MQFDAKISALKEKAVDLGQKLSALTRLRSEHAPAAVDGDAKAAKDFAALGAQAEALRKETESVEMAIAQTQRLQAEAETAAAQADLAKRHADAANLNDAINVENAKIDELMVKLREVCERRTNLIAQLGATRTVPSGMLSRLRSTSLLAGAARAAGLDRHLAIEHVAPMFVKKMHRNGAAK